MRGPVGTHAPDVRRRSAERRALLRGASPAALLPRLVQGDPLGIRGVVQERLIERAVLVDADRAFLRALARCARYARDLGARASLERWCREHVDAAIDELQRSEARMDPLPMDPAPSVFSQLARPLGLDATAARAACVAFNARPFEERRAFMDVVLRGHSLDDAARADRLTASEVARRARRVLEACLDASLHVSLSSSAQGAPAPNPPSGASGPPSRPRAVGFADLADERTSVPATGAVPGRDPTEQRDGPTGFRMPDGIRPPSGDGAGGPGDEGSERES